MKTNLITTKDYLLLIDEEAEIKPGDYIIHDTVEGIVEANDEWYYRGEKDNYWNKVIAFYPLTKEAKELEGLPLLPPFEEVDIEKLAKYHYGNNRKTREYEEGFLLGFDLGYKAAQAKQLELLKRAIQLASDAENIEEVEEEIIQSLSTQQLPKGFIPSIELVLTDIESDIVGDDGEYIYINEERLKTITNSEGKEVLMGEYKY